MRERVRSVRGWGSVESAEEFLSTELSLHCPRLLGIVVGVAEA